MLKNWSIKRLLADRFDLWDVLSNACYRPISNFNFEAKNVFKIFPSSTFREMGAFPH